MSARTASCPNCGAAVTFRWSAAVQTTCAYCRSVLVRHDLDWEKVGTVADLPLTPSPIQLGTAGQWEGRSFHVVGRIVYGWERGGWNEWHAVTNDGRSLWLADAQGEYVVSTLATPDEPLPPAHALRVGQRFAWDGHRYEVVRLTPARYLGVEGELPFEYWDKEEVLFADLGSADARVATIDYSEPVPLLFLGRHAEFDALRLTGLRRFEGW